MGGKALRAAGLVGLGVATGCLSHMPQTAAEFRTAVQGGAFMTRVTSFEVARPVGEVGRTFQAKAPECLSVKVATESRTSGSYQYIVAAYKPTVIVDERHAELHVQQKHERGVKTVYEEPPDGHYYVVADALPKDTGATRVDIYGPSGGAEVIIEAIREWANGRDQGCPDLAKQ